MKFGDVEELQELVTQAEDIELHGTAVERMIQAKTAIYVLLEAHEEAISSASVAVDNLLRAEIPGYRQHPEITKFPAKHEGYYEGIGVYKTDTPNGQLAGSDGAGPGANSAMMRLADADLTVILIDNMAPDGGASELLVLDVVRVVLATA